MLSQSLIQSSFSLQERYFNNQHVTLQFLSANSHLQQNALFRAFCGDLPQNALDPSSLSPQGAGVSALVGHPRKNIFIAFWGHFFEPRWSSSTAILKSQKFLKQNYQKVLDVFQSHENSKNLTKYGFKNIFQAPTASMGVFGYCQWVIMVITLWYPNISIFGREWSFVVGRQWAPFGLKDKICRKLQQRYVDQPILVETYYQKFNIDLIVTSVRGL